MTERRLEKFFLPGYAAVIRPARPEAKNRAEAVDTQDQLLELVLKLNAKQKARVCLWAHMACAPSVAERIERFCEVHALSELRPLTPREKKLLCEKIKEARV